MINGSAPRADPGLAPAFGGQRQDADCDGGLAGKNGGQIGAAILRAPMEWFTAAAAAYQEKHAG
jgi:hypothetical protein